MRPCSSRVCSTLTRAAWFASDVHKPAPSRPGEARSSRCRPRWRPASHAATGRLSSDAGSTDGSIGGGLVGMSLSTSMGDGLRCTGEIGRRGMGSNDSMPGRRTGCCWLGPFTTWRGSGGGAVSDRCDVFIIVDMRLPPPLKVESGCQVLLRQASSAAEPTESRRE